MKGWVNFPIHVSRTFIQLSMNERGPLHVEVILGSDYILTSDGLGPAK